MEKDKELIIINGKNKTESIIKYDFDGSKYNICFVNSAKVYSYNKNNVKILHCKGLIDSSEYKIIVKNKPLANVKYALDFKEYIKVFFNNGKKNVYL